MKRLAFFLIMFFAYLRGIEAYSFANDFSMQQFFARSSFTYQYNARISDEWYLETIQPVYISKDSYQNTLFWQGEAVAAEHGGVFNIGIGYRLLTLKENLLLGVNAFYDVATYHKQNFSIGGDLQTKWVTILGNYYYRFQSFAHGNIEVIAPMPHFPWLRVGGGYLFLEKGGYSFKVLANIWGPLSLEGGRVQNHKKYTNYLRINLTLGIPNRTQFTLYQDKYTKDPFPPKFLKKFVLELVDRFNLVL